MWAEKALLNLASFNGLQDLRSRSMDLHEFSWIDHGFEVQRPRARYSKYNSKPKAHKALAR